MRVVVSGWVAPFPVAGFLWHAVSYALGFRDLGHEVWYVEDPGWTADRGFDPVTRLPDPDCDAGARFLAEELDRIGLTGRWGLRHPSGRVSGLSTSELDEVLRGADLLVNVSLLLPDRPEYRCIPHRFAIDTDPVFTQVGVARGWDVAERHTRLFTFGRPPLPGQRPAHEWLPTRQAVHAESWPVAPASRPGDPFTTVTAWQAFSKPLVFEGREYGMKDRSIREHLDLPGRTAVPIEIGLAGGEGAEEGGPVLAAHGWRITDALAATRSSVDYRTFISSSAGEIGFAKHAYAVARCGWFSDRTCCYLASGRPAIVQDTGWVDWLPSGEGILAFRTTAEAAAGLEKVAADPGRHAAAARKLAEEHFDAARVCAALLEAGI
jgi:hypothetical protein